MRLPLPRPERPAGDYDLHHVFYGAGNRKHSDKWNCIIYLPRHLHDTNYTTSVHRDKALDMVLKQEYQMMLEEAGWTREEFRTTFGRSYIS
jgi:hypothetical protein